MTKGDDDHEDDTGKFPRLPLIVLVLVLVVLDL
jgi:hypothetical protein